MSELPAPAQRVLADAAAKGLDLDIIKTEATARSAEEAAQAVGVAVGQIVKSLVFKGRESGKPYLLLVSGSNRVNEKGVAARLGEKLVRPDADFVREATGFAIGGVSPFGASGALTTFMDEALLAFETVWAAAGTPFHVFPVAPRVLCEATGATLIPVS
ncbi:YbaK/EbsC family protein [Consotaella salsifontis]|uniref:Cys-tRNA(Pro) deacylase, prolyl-tRNA editing enzyme YbaK/EbsC n=1 Tax=Consotaella salsifontis TaxID=1365950 RepID=A0A1T4T4V1_9HYPH|nr:YbaK/EbsC family protein [Consotaella salsifontis]SKA35466.1 Cys-tRNA(Pro) deacylase, prolyl-tRNA editing enzyme YbaK/EbsC [Consotaella salsifontis]